MYIYTYTRGYAYTMLQHPNHLIHCHVKASDLHALIAAALTFKKPIMLGTLFVMIMLATTIACIAIAKPSYLRGFRFL